MCKKEVWKDIPGYEGYYKISTNGRIKSLDRIEKCGKRYRKRASRILKGVKAPTGYLHVSLYKNGLQSVQSIHSLVAMVFLGHSPVKGKIAVDHINGIKTDNRVENLQVITVMQNIIKSSKNKTGFTGVTKRGPNKYHAQISVNRKTKFLGVFETKEDAAKVYEDTLTSLYTAAEVQFLKEMGYL